MNPSSENFILKKAFIPQDGFLEASFNGFYDALTDRFPVIGQIGELLAVFSGLDMVEAIPDITVSLPGFGTFTVVNFTWLNQSAGTIRIWMSILMYAMLGFFLVREAPRLFGHMY